MYGNSGYGAYPGAGVGGMMMGTGMNPMLMRQQRPMMMMPGGAVGRPYPGPMNPMMGLPPGVPQSGPPPPMSADERRLQHAQQRQQLLAQVFEVIGRVLQLGAVLATSGHQILSIVIGTTVAVRTARSFFPAQRIQGPNPAFVEGADAFTRSSSFGSPDARSMVSSPTAAGSVGEVAAAASSDGWIRRTLSAISRSPSAIIALIGAIVALEHFVTKWRHQRHLDELEAEERALGLDANVTESMNDVRQATSAMLVEANASRVPVTGLESEALSPGDTYVARHRFEAKEDNQLSLEPGDQITITQFDPSGWCWASVTNVRRGSSYSRQGFVPGNYVEKLVAAQRRL